MTIAKLKKSDLNQLEKKGELSHRKNLFFKVAIANLDILIDNNKGKR